MILGAIIGLIALLVNLFLQPFPVFYGFPSGVDSALNWITTSIHGMNSIFPMDTLFEIIGLVVAMEILWSLWKIAEWVIKIIKP